MISVGVQFVGTRTGQRRRLVGQIQSAVFVRGHMPNDYGKGNLCDNDLFLFPTLNVFVSVIGGGIVTYYHPHD